MQFCEAADFVMAEFELFQTSNQARVEKLVMNDLVIITFRAPRWLCVYGVLCSG
jgi:hypothetical protein